MAEKLYSLKGVEIFRTGTWHGKEYTEKDIEDMIHAFDTFKESWYRPAIKDGHHEVSGKPALGYVDKLKQKGSKVIADIVDMPKAVYDAIKQHKYDRVSIELMSKVKKDGKVFKSVLWALSILGVEVPEVSGLKPLRDSLEAGADIVAFDTALVVDETIPNGDGKVKDKKSAPEGFIYWPETYVNELPDDAFAVIASQGELDSGGRTTPRTLRYFPHHNINVTSADEHSSVDLPHLRMAMVDLPESDLTSAEKAEALTHLESHEKALLNKGDGISMTMKRTKEPENKDKSKSKEEEEMEVKEYEAKIEKLTKEIEASKAKIIELEKLSAVDDNNDDKSAKMRAIISNLSETQEKLSAQIAKTAESQEKISRLEEERRKERIDQKVGKLRVPAFRFFAEQFYDWATKEGENIISFTQDGIKKEKLAEQVVDEFCATLNKATANLTIQSGKVESFKRDDVPEDDNPRVQVDNCVKAYQHEHPEVSYNDAMAKVFEADPDLKRAYANS